VIMMVGGEAGTHGVQQTMVWPMVPVDFGMVRLLWFQQHWILGWGGWWGWRALGYLDLVS